MKKINPPEAKGKKPKIPPGWHRVPTGRKVRKGDKIYWEHFQIWGKPITSDCETEEPVHANEICIRRNSRVTPKFPTPKPSRRAG